MKPTRRGPEVTISIVTLLLAGLGVALQAVALTPSLTIRISVLVLLGICVAAGLLAAATHKASVAFGAATVATLVVISLLTMIALTPPSTSPSTQVPDTGSQQPSDTVDSRLSLVLAEVQDQTAEFEYDSAIDITIRNAGRQRAALTRADLTIVDYAFVQT